MSVQTLIPVADYLNVAYSPDREYVDGAVLERNVGEWPHSLVQRNLILKLSSYPDVWAMPELRVQTAKTRYRVPDVAVVLERPASDIVETPPLLCIEILSRRDEMSSVLEKLEEYAAAGVRHIWVFDPRRRKAYTYAGRKLEEVRADSLATDLPEVGIDLAEAFRGLD